MASWRIAICVISILIDSSISLFDPLGIDEFYIKTCDRKLLHTKNKHQKCLKRKFEIKTDTEENQSYVQCMFEHLGYIDSKGEFDKQTLLEDYHRYGIKNRDKAVQDSFDGCMKQHGPTPNSVEILHCLTEDEDFPEVMNARREWSDFQPEWMQALCGGLSLGFR